MIGRLPAKVFPVWGLPGEPFERVIEYIAPFYCCDRELDYEIAYGFFSC
ncbi:hypothetical protein K8T06_02050 [bacterium]|nr:hypothetical protein [bacterium]